jgi:hypothetical protein
MSISNAKELLFIVAEVGFLVINVEGYFKLSFIRTKMSNLDINLWIYFKLSLMNDMWIP